MSGGHSRLTRNAARGSCAIQLLMVGTALATIGSLTACETAATRTQTVEVKIPVAVQPIKPEQVPTPPAPLGPRPGNLSAAADILLSKVCEFVGYAIKADPLLRLSAGQQQGALPKYPECER